ncbi:PREDICTED: putative F-box protein At1g58090 [Camelina sativa]|uniref:F-box protein At1g58090 n=1 Tax=Camelina sativa TaxID=90675 RepID=A0ABM1QQS5_CAMSA|nr:PREDICTED: putative F-box protein At1g58090 [Camelina sativa]
MEQWNNLLSSKRFVNKNFACAPPEFMLHTHSDVYSVSADPTIKVIDLRIDLCCRHYHVSGICDGHVFVDSLEEGDFVLNPLLRKCKYIPRDGICDRDMGYDGSRPEKSFKIIGRRSSNTTDRVAILELATNEWKVYED